MARAAPGLFALTALLGAGCEPDPADELLVHVVDGSGGAMRVPEDLDGFEITVSTLRGRGDPPLVRFRGTWRLVPTEGEAPEGAVALPQTLAIVPDSTDGTGSVRVDVVGLRSGRAIQRTHRNAAFGVGRVDLPPFALTPLCFGVECPPDQTCESDGTCRGAEGIPDGGVPETDAGPCGAGLVVCGDSCVASDESHCGACDVSCAPDERCVAGVCACGVGLVRCGGECVDLGSDDAHCGACDAPCALLHATASCVGGTCAVSGCDAGWGDCNGSPADGCETGLGTPSNCGACGARCAFAHAAARCDGGTCALGRCNAGFGNCDGSAANGCEQRLDTVDHCGACGARCAPPHGTGTCWSGRCTVASCDSGWDDCNGGPGDGCETRLDTESNCGSCGASCPTNELCDGASCYCTRPSWDHNSTGQCVPSCGHLLNMTGSPRGGTSCCSAGCSTPVVGSPGDTYDCNWCCEADTGVNGCL